MKILMSETEAIQEIMDIQIRDIRTRDDENQLRHQIFQSSIEMEIMEEAKNKILLKLTNHGVNYRWDWFTESLALRNLIHRIIDSPNNRFTEKSIHRKIDSPKRRFNESFDYSKIDDIFSHVIPD